MIPASLSEAELASLCFQASREIRSRCARGRAMELAPHLPAISHAINDLLRTRMLVEGARQQRELHQLLNRQTPQIGDKAL